MTSFVNDAILKLISSDFQVLATLNNTFL